jgi:hypothetical protein
MDPDPDYCARIIAARCPEICDYVVPVGVIEAAIEVIDALTDEINAISEPAGGRFEAGGQDASGHPGKGRPRAA